MSIEAVVIRIERACRELPSRLWVPEDFTEQNVADRERISDLYSDFKGSHSFEESARLARLTVIREILDEECPQCALAAVTAERDQMRAALVAQEDAERMTQAGLSSVLTFPEFEALIVEFEQKYGRGDIHSIARELRRAALAGKGGET